MALRTIAGAFFNYKREDGSLATAQRGETVDIPEGEDLTRGDKFGAFTPKVDDEPIPPVGSELLRPQLDWSDSEFDRYTDAAHVTELKDQFALVHPIDQPVLAAKLLASENRKNTPRSRVVSFLEEALGVATPPTGSTESPDGTVLPPGDVITPAGTVDTITAAHSVGQTDGTGIVEPPVVEDELTEFVKTANVSDLLARAGDDKALAQQLLDAEVVDRNRKTAVDGLKAIVEA